MSEKIKEISLSPEKTAGIKFLLLDVDGVLTNGDIIYSSNGSDIKIFNVKDGAGIKYWLRSGRKIGIISGRSSSAIVRRAEELGITLLEMDAKDKLPAAKRMLATAGVTFQELAVVGDDLPDIPLMRRAALSFAVADARPEVIGEAQVVTALPGGGGAVREIIDAILKSQGVWGDIMSRYLA